MCGNILKSWHLVAVQRDLGGQKYFDIFFTAAVDNNAIS